MSTVTVAVAVKLGSPPSLATAMTCNIRENSVYAFFGVKNVHIPVVYYHSISSYNGYKVLDISAPEKKKQTKTQKPFYNKTKTPCLSCISCSCFCYLTPQKEQLMFQL